MKQARLTALRLVGFKSFAERTTVEFGPGISAVVGPNGSGKSNLADALRWTLGEQGRSLRTRRSEDVIFAGSSARRAIGMADVTLVIDNQDRMLPVDFGEVEIGRRLYRSGENEYLLNRQRIRLRDLIEMLDAGNLADNAFLFIGQGMVDQALALRPEERRPLFEEAAGVRRHERRRRQAESELVEAESNLERLRDLLGELRPQARRLAAQAEQLQARQTAGLELAEALLAAARARWAALSKTAADEQLELDGARAAADRALSDLKAAEEEATALSAQIGRRAEAEREQRRILDGHRERLSRLRIDAARLESELAALERDRSRVAAERAAAEERRATSLSALSRLPMSADPALARELELVEQQLAEIEHAASDPSPAGRSSQAIAAELAARRAERAAQAHKVDSMERTVRQAEDRLAQLEADLETSEAERAGVTQAAADVAEADRTAQAALLEARSSLDSASEKRASAQQRLAALEGDAAAARGHLASLEAALSVETDVGLARAARARGGSRLTDGLEVEPRFQQAVAAALGSAAAAFIVEADAILPLAARRGTVVTALPAARRAAAAGAAVTVEAAALFGGGRLAEAVRRDPRGQVSRLLERVVWLPDLASALQLRPKLAVGWGAVTLAGELVDDRGVVTLSTGESVVDRQAERDRAAEELAGLERQLAVERESFERQVEGVHAAAQAVMTAQERHDAARAEVGRADEAERLAARRVDQLSRDAEWERARLERMQAERGAALKLADTLSEQIERLEADLSGVGETPGDPTVDSLRADDLRAQRDELGRRRAEQDAAIRADEEARRRAEIGLVLDESRLREIDAEGHRLTERAAELANRRLDLSSSLTSAEKNEAEVTAEVESLFAAGADERTRLVAAEKRAVTARDGLREAETRSRAAEVRSMEARLHLEQTREQLLVELAGIGGDGVTALNRAGAGEAGHAEVSLDEQADAEALEGALGRAIERWEAAQPDGPSPPPARLAALRRRFHELGAGNPFAVQEYAELRERLELLESQHADMQAAIAATRDLIASLNTLIHDQFRSTFAALEGAFARRFEELFGGGDAQLSLTAPDDLSSTGIEIHARPPGKRRQPLSMLSGGERALTAVSLLMAMLEVRPVPFCVLDEVDAALDEANIGRFSKALRGLAEQTQFIVITHNRGTIESADALYGVTIGEDAVSRVVSLRLPGSSDNGGAVEGRLAETVAT